MSRRSSAWPPGCRSRCRRGCRRSCTACSAWLDPAGAHALLHGDPCPDNAVQGRDGIRFIDLEVADLGPGTAELAYLRIGWPTCWCATSVPEPVLSRAEAAYRSTWRSLTGTELHGNLADACAGVARSAPTGWSSRSTAADSPA